jgi:hypothetical protein
MKVCSDAVHGRHAGCGSKDNAGLRHRLAIRLPSTASETLDKNSLS